MRGGGHKAAVESVRRLVEALGGVCNVLSQSHRLRGSRGLPDLFIQLPANRGRVKKPATFWCEVKVAGDRLRPGQREFKEREEACGGKVIVGGVDEVLEFLKPFLSRRVQVA